MSHRFALGYRQETTRPSPDDLTDDMDSIQEKPCFVANAADAIYDCSRTAWRQADVRLIGHLFNKKRALKK